MSLMLLGVLNSQAAAGGHQPAYELITERAMTGTTYTINSIPQTYKNLYMQIIFRTTLSAGQPLLVRINDDTANYYEQEQLMQSTNTAAASKFTSSAFVIRTSAGIDTSAVASATITFADYTSSTKRHQMSANTTCYDQDKRLYFHSGFYTNPSNLPINSLTFVPGAYNLTETYISLYGLKG